MIKLWSFIKGILIQNDSDRSKQLALEVDASASSGTVTTLKSKQTLSRTLDLPNTSGELVEKDFAQTLTNKTIDDDNNILQNIALTSMKTVLADANKFVARDVSGQVVSTNTVPNGTVVGTTDTQTLTNKTISGITNTITNVDADNVVVDPIANLSATNAQAAFAELQGDIDGLGANKVTGPASSTDNALSRFDGTTGKLVQNSGVIVDDSNNITGVNNLTVNGNTIIQGNLEVNGTTTTINTQTLDVEDTNVTVNFNGTDITAEGAGLTIDRTGTSGSLVYEDALPSKFKAGPLGSEIQLANVSSAQSFTNKNLKSNTNLLTGARADNLQRETGNQQVVTIPDVTSPDTLLTQAATQVITNKDIDGGTASNTSRITVPRNTLTNLLALTRKEGTIVYATDTDKFYSDDGATLKEIGSGAGEKNFISNGDAEANTAGWNVYSDVAGIRPVDGTGGTPSPSVNITRSTTNPLEGSASFILTKGAGNFQGHGFSYDYPIDNASKAKVLTVEMNYIVDSGTFVAGNNTTNSDLGVYLYDVSNSTLIEPSSTKFFSNSSTISDKYSATFQTSATGSQYRLIIHISSTSTAAYALKVDGIKVSPSSYIFGTPVTDWQSFTPTGTWTTNTTYAGRFRRVGDSIEMFVSVSLTGAPNAASLLINPPSGISFDTTKLALNNRHPWGHGQLVRGGTAISVHVNGSGNSIEPLYDTNGAVGTAFAEGGITNILPQTFASGDFLNLYIKAPVVGWSSSVQNSDNADTRVIAGSASSTGSTTIANTNTTLIQLGATTNDSHAGFTTGASSRYTASVSGWYSISTSVAAQVTYATTGNFTQIFLFRNGSSVLALDTFQPSAGTGVATNTYLKGTKIIFLNAGDFVDIRGFNNSGASGNFTILDLSITRQSGPSAITATETISAAGSNTSGQSFANGVQQTITNWTEDYDTHGAFNATTGIYTCPISGKYLVTLNVAIAAGFTANSGDLSAILIQTGSITRASADTRAFGSNTGNVHMASTTYTFDCKAGDLITLQAGQSNGATRSLFSADANRVKFSISRIGN